MAESVTAYRRWILAATAAVLLMPGMCGAQAAVPFGDLIGIDGQPLERTVTVGDGQWTLVMLWASDCLICRHQEPLISAFHEQHRDDDARVIGIALDGREGLNAVNEYLAAQPASFPNYVGEFPIIAINYQQMTAEPLRGTPTYLLFDRQGSLRGSNPGPLTVAALENFIARHDAAPAPAVSDASGQ